MVDSVDAEQLIDAIQARPSIWDVFSQDYHDRFKTRNSWYEVGKVFYPEFDTLSESQKHSIVLLVQRKWRNMRDCYVKDLRQWTSNSSTPSKITKRRKYIFCERLSFLRNSVEAKFTRKPQPMKRERQDSENSLSDEDVYLSGTIASEADNIDPKALISVVELTPCIWDVTCPEYHDRVKTKEGWLNVCRTFYPHYDDLQESDRINLLGSVQKKWRNFRDCFMKDWKASQNPSLRALRRRKYVFSDRLSFLLKSIEWKVKNNPQAPLLEDTRHSDEMSFIDYDTSFVGQEPYGDEENTNHSEPEQKYNPHEDERNAPRSEDQEQFYPICSISNSPQNVQKHHDQQEQGSRKRPITPPEQETTSVGTRQDTLMNSSLPILDNTFSQSLLVDDDIAFFFSLLPTVRRFDEDTKFEFRMELMKLVKTMKCKKTSKK